MKIEFQNSVRRLNFLCRLPDIKIAWTNPCCGICGIANNWFKSYLFDRKQFVSINGHVSNQTSVKYGVPQGSVLGSLLFLIYVNDLNHAIKFCKIHHSADDTNLLHLSKSVNKLNKYINFDMKNHAHVKMVGHTSEFLFGIY